MIYASNNVTQLVAPVLVIWNTENSVSIFTQGIAIETKVKRRKTIPLQISEKQFLKCKCEKIIFSYWFSFSFH